MNYEAYKSILLNQEFINLMQIEDKEFFRNKIINMKTINNLNYYITKYNLTSNMVDLIIKYNFYTNNYTQNMIIKY